MRLVRDVAVVLCAAALVATCSCSPHGGGATAESAGAISFPSGILDTSEARSLIRGIYPDSGARTPSCCWTGPDVYFIVAARPEAKTIALTLYEPAIKDVAASQTVTLFDGHGKPAASRKVARGAQTIALPLPRDVLNAGIASVHLRFARSVVPKDAGMNGDIRRLSVILSGVTTY